MTHDTNNTDGWHSRSGTQLFTHRGATDGWWVRTGRGKYWTVSSVFLYSPSNHRRGLYALTIHSLYSPGSFFPQFISELCSQFWSTLWRGRLHSAQFRSGDVEDGTDAEEKSPQSSTELRNEVELHHLTQMVVVAGGMRLELREKLQG